MGGPTLYMIWFILKTGSPFVSLLQSFSGHTALIRLGYRLFHEMATCKNGNAKYINILYIHFILYIYIFCIYIYTIHMYIYIYTKSFLCRLSLRFHYTCFESLQVRNEHVHSTITLMHHYVNQSRLLNISSKACLQLGHLTLTINWIYNSCN